MSCNTTSGMLPLYSGTVEVHWVSLGQSESIEKTRLRHCAIASDTRNPSSWSSDTTVDRRLARVSAALASWTRSTNGSWFGQNVQKMIFVDFFVASWSTSRHQLPHIDRSILVAFASRRVSSAGRRNSSGGLYGLTQRSPGHLLSFRMFGELHNRYADKHTLSLSISPSLFLYLSISDTWQLYEPALNNTGVHKHGEFECCNIIMVQWINTRSFCHHEFSISILTNVLDRQR